MTPENFRDALHLLDSTLALFESRHDTDPFELRRQLRSLSLEMDLLRVRLGQPAAAWERN